MSDLPMTYLESLPKCVGSTLIFLGNQVKFRKYFTAEDNVCEQYTHSFRFKRWLDLFVLQLFPVYIAEEGVFLDVSLPLWTTAQTLTWMFGHELKKKKLTNIKSKRSLGKCGFLHSQDWTINHINGITKMISFWLKCTCMTAFRCDYCHLSVSRQPIITHYQVKSSLDRDV